MKKREEIEEKYKWDLTKFCKNNDDFYVRLENLKPKVDEFKIYEGKLKDSDEILFECLEKLISFNKESGLLYVYASLYKKGDNANEEANIMCEKISEFLNKNVSKMVFIDVEISKFSRQSFNGK